MEKCPENTTGNTLSVATYNFYIRPPCLGIGEFKDLRSYNLASLLFKRGFNNPGNNLANIDVFCFQEVFAPRNDRRTKLIETMAQIHNLKYSKAGPKQPFFSKAVADSGLLTLSKYPIVDSDFYHYKHSSQVDALSWKGVLYTKILVQDKPNAKSYLHLFNTHLQATYTGASYKKKNHSSYTARLNQSLELSNFIHKKMESVAAEEKKRADSGSEGPVKHSFMLCGDLNIRSDKFYHPTNPELDWKLLNTDSVTWIKDQQPKKFFYELQYFKNCIENKWTVEQPKTCTVSNVYEEFSSRPDYKSSEYLNFYRKIHSLPNPTPDPNDSLTTPDTAGYCIKTKSNPKTKFVFKDISCRQVKLDYVMKMAPPNLTGLLSEVQSVNVLPMLTKGEPHLEKSVLRMSDHNLVHAQFKLNI